MADFLIPMEAGFWLAFATAAITVALIVVLLRLAGTALSPGYFGRVSGSPG
jgi:hypothetical protein